MNEFQDHPDSIFDPRHIPSVSKETRFANWIIDRVVTFIIVFGTAYAFGAFYVLKGGDTQDLTEMAGFKIIDILYGWLVYILYYTLLEGATKGRSIGKLATGTAAVNSDDYSAISWGAALKRSLVRIIPFEAFSGLGNAPWHDSMTRTTVVRMTDLHRAFFDTSDNKSDIFQ